VIKSRRIWGWGACSTHGRNEKYIFWLENLKIREPRRPGHRWEDNIRMDLRDIAWESVH